MGEVGERFCRSDDSWVLSDDELVPSSVPALGGQVHMSLKKGAERGRSTRLPSWIHLATNMPISSISRHTEERVGLVWGQGAGKSP